MKNIITLLIFCISTISITFANNHYHTNKSFTINLSQYKTTHNFKFINLGTSTKLLSIYSNYYTYKNYSFLHPVENKTKEAINWQLADMPINIVKKHHAGIGLTAAGSVFTAFGTILIFATINKSNARASGGSASVSGAPAIGFMLDFAGIPMLIAGLVKTSKANKLARFYVSSKEVTN